MATSFNCLVLSDTFNNLDTFSVNIEKNDDGILFIMLGNRRYDFKKFKVDHLKDYICNRKNVVDSDKHAVKLWKVDVYVEMINDRETLLKDEMMPQRLFCRYFEAKPKNHDLEKIHIIAIIPATTEFPNKRPRLDFNDIPLDLERPPTSLLNTGGLSWDYQESPELEKELRGHVQKLYDVFKKDQRDKSNTPVFFMVSGAGCGKSRNATEFPRILRRIFVNDLELKSRLESALTFAITLENGTKINTAVETDANVSIAKRMLYQYQDQLLWDGIRKDTQTPSIIDILERCAKQKNVALKELTVILVIDGLQTALIGEYDGLDKQSLFYSFLTEISLLVTNNKYPLVIACCTATFARPFTELVSGSHQLRIFLPIRSLEPPKKGGKEIFKDTPLLRMLIDDMGGNGRALEALELAVKDKDLENISFFSIAEDVHYQLVNLYDEWVNKTRYLAPILRAILTHTSLVASEPVPGTNILPEELSKLGLIKFKKLNEKSDVGTLTCPYIWLWLMANASNDKILNNWNFEYYKSRQTNDPTIPPGCQYWQHFEHFIASFRVLKSNVFESDKEIELQVIHAGANHNFGTATIKNKPLSLEKAIQQENTKSSAYVNGGSLFCDNRIIELKNASACIINEPGAPYGDSFCTIYLNNSTQFRTESHQCKLLKSKAVSQDDFDKEYDKAADDGDVFILFTCGSSDISTLKPLSAIVDDKHWNSYFGPFAGRAFQSGQSNGFNANKATYSELTAVTGIGDTLAKKLMFERQKNNEDYRNLEDCYNRTKISRNILINLRFDSSTESI